MITEHAQMEADFEKEFEKKTWSNDTVKTLKNFIRRQLERIERAYGGCRECYGKGYATEQARGHDDTPVRRMNFCICERGMQLKIYWNEAKT